MRYVQIMAKISTKLQLSVASGIRLTMIARYSVIRLDGAQSLCNLAARRGSMTAVGESGTLSIMLNPNRGLFCAVSSASARREYHVP